MKRIQVKLVAAALIIGISMLSVFAQFNRDNGYGNRGNDRQIRILINQIEVKSDSFRNQLNRAMYDTMGNSQNIRYINQTVTNFEDAVDRMKQNYADNRDITNDLRDVLTKANQIENMMRQYRFNPQTENAWRLLKTDLNTLSRYYNSNGGWNSPNYNSLNGTYRLNVYQSDDVNAAIDRVLYDSNYNRRDRQRANLQRRLAVPEYLAIEKSSNYTVKMASSNASQTTFEANGRPQTEYLNNGRMMTTTATLSGKKLVINSDGDQMNAFYIAFEPFQNGQKLKVTRKLYLENRGQTITVSSVYDKTSNVAQWNLYRNDGYSNVNYPNDNYGNNYGFAIPNGTRMTATLNTDLSTRDNLEGQRFTMTVTSPSSYYGAVIEGTVSKANRSGRFTGNAELGLNFERIRLRNGATYRFEGLIENVVTPNGKTIKVDNENSIRSGSQTKDTVVRSGIGAAVGAIIGGLTGGEKGAIIGAAIGAGAGSGSILVQGRDNIELNNGTTFYLTASSNVR
jgi:hypothetical protein